MHGTYLMDGKKASEFFSIDTVVVGDVDDMVGYSKTEWLHFRDAFVDGKVNFKQLYIFLGIFLDGKMKL
jgi:hypothetical protein